VATDQTTRPVPADERLRTRVSVGPRDLPPDNRPGEYGFPAIGEHSLLSDCENTALVALDGSVEWICLPKPHDPSVFGALLDRSAGRFRVGPADVVVPAGRRYLPGTLVSETTWQTSSGWMQVQEFLALGPWHRTVDRSALHRRIPKDADSRHALVRLVRCLHGTVDLEIVCEPVFDYGRTEAGWAYTGGNYSSLRAEHSGVTLHLNSDLRFGIEGGAARARHQMHEGEKCFVALGWSDQPLPIDDITAWQTLTDTTEFWRGWLERGAFPDHPWRNALQRSALTLKGLTYSPTGALLAAPTTSLPESLGGQRNWDYRFSWVRDSALALWGLHAVGLDDEADDFVAFLCDALIPGHQGERSTAEGRSTAPVSPANTSSEVRVLYAVDGSPPSETILDHLSGYLDSAPVRIGNAAEHQTQHDIYGAVVDCIYQHTRRRDKLTERVWQLVIVMVERAVTVWATPDQGIWEMRGEPRHFVHSKLMCWVAADRGARLARLRGDIDRSTRWSEAATAIRADICVNGLDDRGVFTQSYGSRNLDASLLLMSLVRFLPPDDPRLRATVLTIGEELQDNGLILRYQPDATNDGIGGGESSFTLCSFWFVSALVEIGEIDRARELCERLLGLGSELGLYAEELDPRTGRHWGNFPQAFTHLALINAVAHIVRVDEADLLTRHHLSWE
jgi:alpha,alpha-trehalase